MYLTDNPGVITTLIGTLRSDYGDGNGNATNNNFTRASRFFVHFFAVTARLRRENA